jgi:hypothetical protein
MKAFKKSSRPNSRAFDQDQVEDLTPIAASLTRSLQIEWLSFEAYCGAKNIGTSRGFAEYVRDSHERDRDNLLHYLWRVKSYSEIEVAVNRYHAEPRRVSYAKSQGYKHPGLYAASNCGLLPFKIWADVWRQYRPESSRDGLDSEGVWGPRASVIERIWFVCGCKATNKFYVCLHMLAKMAMNSLGSRNNQPRFDLEDPKTFVRNLRKSHSAENARHLSKGIMRHNKTGETPSAYITIGKCRNELVWRSLSKSLSDTGRFDFESAAALQHLPVEEQARLLNSKAAWILLHKRIPEVFKANKAKDTPHPSHLSRWPKATGAFISLMQKSDNKEADAIPAFNLAALFGSKTEVEKYLALTGKSLHDAGQFMLPETHKYSREWAGFLMKFPAAATFIGVADKVESVLGRIPSSLSELRAAAAQFTYFNVEDVRVAALAYSCNLTQTQFEDYQRVARKPKSLEMCPGLMQDLDWGGYTFRKLDHDDPTGLFLGLLTDCCQHLHAAGAPCALHGWQKASGAFYVVEYKGRIIAQSWAWRGTKGELVFDSIEGLGGYDVEKIASLYELASEHIIGQLGICKVLIGDTDYGITSEVIRAMEDMKQRRVAFTSLQATLSGEMLDKCSYTDARRQRLIYEDRGLVVVHDQNFQLFEATEVGEDSESDITFDVEVADSGVVCEHCDTEVHPLCNICPNCRQDISRWVA